MADADSIGGNRIHERIEPRHMEADTERDGKRKGGGSTSGSAFWSDHIWLTGADGKARRSKSGLPLLAHGVSNRVGRLRAYGNAIVPPLAAEVIKAFMEADQ
jgi:DNA (cytosine-5)-methyltransferase 1